MGLLQWNERYATGMSAIDDQHQKLFQAVNDLHAGLTAGHATSQIGKTLDFLVDYTVQHFKSEEAAMAQHGFEGLKAHQFEHILLVEEVRLFQEQFHRDPTKVRPMEVARFLGEWLTHHILNMDMQYAAFVRALSSNPKKKA